MGRYNNRVYYYDILYRISLSRRRYIGVRQDLPAIVVRIIAHTTCVRVYIGPSICVGTNNKTYMYM